MTGAKMRPRDSMLEQANSIEIKRSAQTWKRKILRSVSGKHERSLEELLVSTFPSSISPISSSGSSNMGSPGKSSDDELKSSEEKNSMGYFASAWEQDVGADELSSGLGNVTGDKVEMTAAQERSEVLDVSWQYQHIIKSPKPKGPKVKPFIFTQSQQRVSRNLGIAGRKCFICGEFLKTKLQMEKIVDLKCGDSVHQECFNVTIDFKIETLVSSNELWQGGSTTNLDEQVFPTCGGYTCFVNQKNCRCIPVDKVLTDNIVTRALLLQKDKLSREKNNNIYLLSSTLKARDSKNKLEPNSGFQLMKTPRESVASRNMINELGLHFEIEPKFKVESSSEQRILQPSRSNSKSSRYSRSPSPNPSLSTMNTSSIKINEYNHLSQEKIKSIFIEYLLENCPKIVLSNFVEFGELRLMDELLVNLNGHKFHQMIVYLFKNYMIIWSKGVDKAVVFPLDGTIIKAYNPSKLQFTNPACSPPNVLLSCEIGSIIEKWVVAVSDFDYKFPSEILTSTILLPPDIVIREKEIAGWEKSTDINKERLSDSTLGGRDEITLGCTVSTPSIQHFRHSLDINSDSKSTSGLETPLLLESKILDFPSCSNQLISSIQPGSISYDDFDEDSDEDSDKEMIDEFLKQRDNESVDENGWQKLLEDIDILLQESRI